MPPLIPPSYLDAVGHVKTRSPSENGASAGLGGVLHGGIWWSGGGSNSRPSHCERDALPAELPPRGKARILPYRQGCGYHRRMQIAPPFGYKEVVPFLKTQKVRLLAPGQVPEFAQAANAIPVSHT